MSRGRRSFRSNVLAVAYKEAATLRHDRALIGAIVAQPIMLLVLTGFVLSNEPSNVPWAVLDPSPTAESRRLLRDIEATGYFLPPREVYSRSEGRELLRSAEVVAFLAVPRGFRRDVERGRPQVELLLDGSDPLTAARISGYITEVAAGLNLRRGTYAAGDDGPVATRGPLDVRQRFWFNARLRDREFFLTALAGILLTNLCLSVTSLGLVAERESGTYEHMLSLPTTAVEIVLGKLLPHVGISYAVLLFAILAPGLAFGIWPRGSWLALAVVTLPFVLASLAMGVFVSALARTSAQAVFIAVFFILPSMILSGAMFPYQFMPHGVREIGGLMPLRWYQIASRRIIERGAGLEEVLLPVTVLVLIFTAFLLGIRWRVKPRLG